MIHRPSSLVHRPLSAVPGLAFREAGRMVFTGERAALPDLAVLPSPYLEGYLELPPEGMLMVEVSRWCPYACSFCLYGRNMGPRLGSRYFGLERVLAEIAWGKARGIRKVHFVEANLNLVPIFWPLMRALAEINADRQLTFYAELRGEHLTDEVVAALDRANLRYVEVGLQTANPAALKASLRRTDLARWAAGTRRLYSRGIEVFLDVILGLPADDESGVAATLAFIEREELGPYDIFTLQVLPGTAVRGQAAQYGLRFQERPPYYVLATDRLDYAALRRLRAELREHIGVAPDLVEGAPTPRRSALARRAASAPVDQLWLLDDRAGGALPAPPPWDCLAAHVDVALRAEDLDQAAPLLAAAIAQNPTTIFDVYLLCGAHPPAPAELARWRDGLPFSPGYLDRIAVYRRAEPGAGHDRLSPRLFLALPWTATVEPEEYGGVAAVVWRFALAPDEEPPLAAWWAAGGAGIWLDGALTPALHGRLAAWEAETGRMLWE